MWQEGELAADSITADSRTDCITWPSATECRPEHCVFNERPRFWPDVPQDEATYIHRLAVRREFAGGRVSQFMLDWAAERTASLGRRFVRLDCDAARPQLRTVYEAKRIPLSQRSPGGAVPGGAIRAARLFANVTNRSDGDFDVVSRYTFCEYSSAWPAEFELEAGRLRTLIGDRARRRAPYRQHFRPWAGRETGHRSVPVVREIECMDEPAPAMRPPVIELGANMASPAAASSPGPDGHGRHNLHFRLGKPANRATSRLPRLSAKPSRAGPRI